MVNSNEQKYEKYWSLTLAYTDIKSDKFTNTLKAILDFIDSHDTSKYSPELYNSLQEIVGQENGLEGVSLRKSINQFVKLGFINYQLKSYHKDSRIFLEAKTSRRRTTIFSRIVYENASFNRDITKDSKSKEINFLLKTLEEVGRLSKEDIAALMTQEISDFPRGYLIQEELENAKQNADETEFYKRKYNQVNHFKAVLKKLDDLTFVTGFLYFEEDAKVIFGKYLEVDVRKRDNYLHRLYKNQLKEEVEEKEGEIECMLEHLDYPSLVASHIKPFIKSTDDEAYDPDNGLLLSRNMDILFDQGYISFEDNGSIMLASSLSEGLKKFLYKYQLTDIYINEKRKEYLRYHRDSVFRDNCDIVNLV